MKDAEVLLDHLAKQVISARTRLRSLTAARDEAIAQAVGSGELSEAEAARAAGVSPAYAHKAKRYGAKATQTQWPSKSPPK